MTVSQASLAAFHSYYPLMRNLMTVNNALYNVLSKLGK